MTFHRASVQNVFCRVRLLARDDHVCRANAGPSAVMQNPVVSLRFGNYFRGMTGFAYTFAAKRLMTLVMCVALIITGMAAAVAMEHAGHEGSSRVASSASETTSMGHASHHMPSGQADAECCEPETTAASCHVSACCMAELKASDSPTASEHGRSACLQSMVHVAAPSIATPLPERPPRRF